MRALKKDRRDLNVEIDGKVRSEGRTLEFVRPRVDSRPSRHDTSGRLLLFGRNTRSVSNQEPSMTDRFAGKVAVITGGSTGMGFATARRFVQEAMDQVFITGRRQDALDRAVDRKSVV